VHGHLGALVPSQRSPLVIMAASRLSEQTRVPATDIKALLLDQIFG
jgi:hypothetical protein